MADDPLERLARHGRSAVPAPDEGFADRLESHLRVEHSKQDLARRRFSGVLLPRIGVAFAVVLLGVVGALAITSRDGGVPVSVIADEPIAPAAQPSTIAGTDDETDDTTLDDQGVVASPPTATATPSVIPSATPVAPGSDEGGDSGDIEAAPVVVPTASPVATVPPARPGSTATVEPQPSATPDVAPPTPVPTATVGSTPTALPITPQPVPTPTAQPTFTPEPTPSPVPTPTPTVEPVDVDMVCQIRSNNGAVGVVCSWMAPATQVAATHYELWRSRNGGDAQVLSRQRAAAPTTYVDRDVDFGDEVTYLVRALVTSGESNEDQVIAASVRQIIQLPES